jgi:hypothetical protein
MKRRPRRRVTSTRPTAKSRRPSASKPIRSNPTAARPVTARELRALRRAIQRQTRVAVSQVQRVAGSKGRRVAGPQGQRIARSRAARLRWNPEPDDVQRSVARLVLTIVEFLRRLMERQAIRRMEQRTLTKKELEAVGLALMRLEETIGAIGRRFGLSPADLNLDLGPAGTLM